MALRKADMKRRLMEQRDRLLIEVQALQNKIAGLEMAIALIDGEDAMPAPEATRPRRGGSKAAILSLLEEVGTTGLNAASACEIAGRRGINLDRATASSLLSRLKKDEIVVYDGDKYKLKSFAPSPQAPELVTGSPAFKVIGGNSN